MNKETLDVYLLIRDTRIEQIRTVRIFLDKGAPEVDATPPFGYDPRFEPPYVVSPNMIKITWAREKDSDLWKIKNVFAEGWGPDRRIRQAIMSHPSRCPSWVLWLAGQFQPEGDGS